MKLYLLILVLIFGLTSQAQNVDDKIHQTLKNYITEFPDQTQFSVAVVNGEDVEFYGQVKFSDTISQLDNSSSVFQIGSITKVFTSSLLAHLALEKQLKLTDSIQKFFDFSLKNTAITLEQLATHTSGLPRLPSNLNLTTVDLKDPYSSYSEEDLKFYLTSEMKSSTDEQPTYDYSNLGAAVLAKALENASAKTYSQLLSEKIVEPLEMKQTSLVGDYSYNNLVQGLDAQGNSTPVWDMGEFEGAGELLSTTEDLSKFVKAHFEDKDNAYSLTTLPSFMVNSNLRLGLGWHILKATDGNDLFWHNGGTGGFSSSVFMITETQQAVIILSNVSSYHPKAPSVDELGFKLLEIM